MLIIGLAALILVTAIVAKAVTIVPQARVGIVERLGRYRRTLELGLNVVTPFVEQLRTTVDTREQDVSFTSPQVITADSHRLGVEVRLRYRITDPVAATYVIADVRTGIEVLTATVLRNLLADLTLEQARASYHQLGRDLRTHLADGVRGWGINLHHAEITALT